MVSVGKLAKRLRSTRSTRGASRAWIVVPGIAGASRARARLIRTGFLGMSFIDRGSRGEVEGQMHPFQARHRHSGT